MSFEVARLGDAGWVAIALGGEIDFTIEASGVEVSEIALVPFRRIVPPLR